MRLVPWIKVFIRYRIRKANTCLQIFTMKKCALETDFSPGCGMICLSWSVIVVSCFFKSLISFSSWLFPLHKSLLPSTESFTTGWQLQPDGKLLVWELAAPSAALNSASKINISKTILSYYHLGYLEERRHTLYSVLADRNYILSADDNPIKLLHVIKFVFPPAA